ncbi:MAG: methyltransferase domain-containing protein [Clostridia bacterium]|nr:methyltransferase domain-containing protein [Clostridia bacterium]
MAVFDPVQYKMTQKRVWDELSNGWLKWDTLFENGAKKITGRLLDLADIQKGFSVLDIGTGLGEPALSAAVLVGTDGRVVAVEQSEKMLSIAKDKGAHLGNITFINSDAEVVKLSENSIDVALSRWGIMFLPHPVEFFKMIRKVLVPGGSLVASVWGDPPKVPMIGLAFGIIAQAIKLPPPVEGTPGPFSMSNEDKLRGMLLEAGFNDVYLESIPVEFVLESPEEYMDYSNDTIPVWLKQRLQELPKDQLDQIWSEVGSAALRYKGADGKIHMTSETVCFKAK